MPRLVGAAADTTNSLMRCRYLPRPGRDTPPAPTADFHVDSSTAAAPLGSWHKQGCTTARNQTIHTLPSPCPHRHNNTTTHVTPTHTPSPLLSSNLKHTLCHNVTRVHRTHLALSPQLVCQQLQHRATCGVQWWHWWCWLCCSYCWCWCWCWRRQWYWGVGCHGRLAGRNSLRLTCDRQRGCRACVHERGACRRPRTRPRTVCLGRGR